MTLSNEAALSPKTVLGEIKKLGVTHVVWLPDSETNWLYVLMKAEPSLTLVPVCREGHSPMRLCQRRAGEDQAVGGYGDRD